MKSNGLVRRAWFPASDGIARSEPTKRFAAVLADSGMTPDATQPIIAAAMARLLDRMASAPPRRRFRRLPPTRGIYCWGDPGRGKTMLMDYALAQAPMRVHRRHFHDFMREVHARLRVLRQTKARDPIATIAQELALETRVLACDDVRIDDIADAGTMLRLVQALVARGVFLVLTSNIAPEALYRDGLNAHRFAPFAPFLRAHAEVVAINQGLDHRLRTSPRTSPQASLQASLEASLQANFRTSPETSLQTSLWITPDDAAATRRLDALAADLAGKDGLRPRALTLGGGRVLAIRQAAAQTMARLTFAELFDAPLGYADYVALACAYRMVIVDGVPILTPALRPQTRRFMHFVEALYERRVKLAVSAAALPEALCQDPKEREGFARVASRLRAGGTSAH